MGSSSGITHGFIQWKRPRACVGQSVAAFLCYLGCAGYAPGFVSDEARLVLDPTKTAHSVYVLAVLHTSDRSRSRSSIDHLDHLPQ